MKPMNRRAFAASGAAVPVFPAPEAACGGFGGSALKVNETLARRPAVETVAALLEAIGG
ncbi:MAG: hypothetical protein ACWGSQ_17945 [Longimicrobiales bacterium]